MPPPRRLPTGPFVVAATVAAALVMAAPFISDLRRALRNAYPDQFATIINSAIGLVVLLAVGVTLARMTPGVLRDSRSRVLLRLGCMAAAIGFGAAYASWTASDDPNIRAVEHFHFIEYGLIVLLSYRAWRPLNDASTVVLAFSAAFVVGAVEEWFQWFIPVRVGELRDVWLNAVAIGCGLLFAFGVDPLTGERGWWPAGAIHRAAAGVAAVLVAVVAFVHAVHLGYRVAHVEIGAFTAFVSRYDQEELARLVAERTVRWERDGFPLHVVKLSREDQYMSEGVLHVQARNDAWERGDVFTAWRENLILETYYTPVLHTPSYVSKTGHRWPPEQRADAERRAAGDSRPYLSDVQSDQIYLSPAPWWWFGTLALVAALLLGGGALERKNSSP